MIQHTVEDAYMVGRTHFYSTELSGALVLFDTGPPLPGAERGLRERIDLARLKYLFVTHWHVDHCGLASFVIENSDAELFIARRDALKITHHEKRMAGITRILRDQGFSQTFLRDLRDSFDRNNIFPAKPARFRIVEDAPELETLGVRFLSCPGHTQSDIVYLVGDCALTGDILLAEIFQAPLLDVDLGTFDGRFRNYDAYCASLANLVKLRGMRILPGHRHSVATPDDAILWYVNTLLERSAQLIPYQGMPLPEIVERLFRRLVDPFHVYLKVSEILFMRDFLENPDVLKQSLKEIGLLDRLSRPFPSAA